MYTMKLMTCTKFHSGDLTTGCRQCVDGRKSVLFITGICHYQCFYCPISDDKRNQDLVKINELELKEPDKEETLEILFKEIIACQSKGVGITGGDPLARIERTCTYIKALKERFGKQFHIHLYTSLPFVTQEKLLQLDEAGLDELRFHLNVKDNSLWDRIYLAQELNCLVGIEIPSIPGQLENTKNVLDFCKESGVIKFVNLNELEFSDISESKLADEGFYVKNQLSYGIKDSEELAKEVVLYGKSINLPTHYCSAGFKDRVQLGNRLLLRAQSVKKPYDELTEEGMLSRGEIILNSVGLAEEFELEEVYETLKEYYEIPDDAIELFDERILIASWILEEIWRDLQDHKEDFLFGDYLKAAIVTEYPTSDNFLVERSPL